MRASTAEKSPSSGRFGWLARAAHDRDVLFPAAFAALYAGIGLLLLWRAYPIGDLDLETDFYGDMAVAAQKLAAGHFSVLNYPYKGPFYSVALVVLHALVGDWYRSGVVVNVLSAAGVLVLWYRLLLDLYGRQVAGWTMLLAALVVEFEVHSHRATSDLLFLFFALASIYLVCTGTRSRTRLLAAGFLAALAFLTRYNGAYLPLAAGVSVYAADPRGQTRAERLRLLGAYLVGFALLAVPWFAASRHETGRLLWTKNAQNLATGLYPGARFENESLGNLSGFWALLAHDPGQCIKQYCINLASHLVSDMREMLQFPAALLALVGLVGIAAGGATRRQWGLFVFPITNGVLMGLFFYSPRFFLLSVGPYYASGLAALFGGDGGAAAAAVRRLRSPFGARRPKTTVRPRRTPAAQPSRLPATLFLVAFVPAVVGFQLYRIYKTERTYYTRRPLNVLQAAHLLRQHVPPGPPPVIMARKGHVALHSGLVYQPYPVAAAASLDNLLQFARAQHVRYLAFGLAEYQLMPQLRFMAMLDTVPGLREVCRAANLRIFEIPAEPSPANVSPAVREQFLLANLTAARAEHDADHIFRASSNLGLFYVDHGLPDRCIELMGEGMQVLEREPHKDSWVIRDLAIARHNLAAVLVDSGRPGEALAYLQQNLDYFRTQGSKDDRARCLDLFAQCLQALGQRDEATTNFQSAADLYTEVGNQARADTIRAHLRLRSMVPTRKRVVATEAP